MIGNSRMAPYSFTHPEEKEIYQKYFRQTGESWLTTVNRYGSKALKAKWERAAKKGAINEI